MSRKTHGFTPLEHVLPAGHKITEGSEGMAKKQKSKLLIKCEPLPVIPRLAKTVGLNQAIIMQQIHYWVQVNKENGKNYRDSYYWTYSTLKGWQQQFPFWSISTIQRTLDQMKSDGLIITGNYNRRKGDRTVWYRINDLVYKELAEIAEGMAGKGSIWPSD